MNIGASKVNVILPRRTPFIALRGCDCVRNESTQLLIYQTIAE